ncbi:unnamed protein product [Rotaria sp. Silwood2]|nr:unnamed protein product [Rotaria sp. Silwood2]CAF3198719.1 unnamed protein product [Rotaria sp. Silwood2]CAF4135334.1 unnamed protein product [Rotaria sp. Silwood2]
MYPSIRNTCVKGYLIINAIICAPTVDIQYRGTSPPKQLRVPSSDCVLPSSTARVSESIPIWTQNLQP